MQYTPSADLVQNSPCTSMWILEDDKSQSRLLRNGQKCVVGRSHKNCAWVVESKAVSKVHVELLPLTNDQLQITDLGSKLGTFVNKEPLEANKPQTLPPSTYSISLGGKVTTLKLVHARLRIGHSTSVDATIFEKLRSQLDVEVSIDVSTKSSVYVQAHRSPGALAAILHHVPVVTQDYIADLAQNIPKLYDNYYGSLPDTRKYPPEGPKIVERSRVGLFCGFTFLFLDKEQYGRLKGPLKMVQGVSFYCENSSQVLDRIKNKDGQLVMVIPRSVTDPVVQHEFEQGLLCFSSGVGREPVGANTLYEAAALCDTSLLLKPVEQTDAQVEVPETPKANPQQTVQKTIVDEETIMLTEPSQTSQLTPQQAAQKSHAVKEPVPAEPETSNETKPTQKHTSLPDIEIIPEPPCEFYIVNSGHLAFERKLDDRAERPNFKKFRKHRRSAGPETQCAINYTVETTFDDVSSTAGGKSAKKETKSVPDRQARATRSADKPAVPARDDINEDESIPQFRFSRNTATAI
ncbi:hypothetical protein CANCADRAFT_32889 [Tortispora caseinolytica NRRL Y-17796]|uniref:FHA domain-containing protein n=1 Tax=Tortispora caseinolytica NRRL Y-17796 TaxID=767744 RepID=A0A1E4TD84_9ASCO|nr:hypothetical protein CANCADRAFT_32889 [Tortispora caseinolytica NRRL Y-17796]